MADSKPIVTQANGDRLLQPSTPDYTSAAGMVLDRNWAKNAFAVGGDVYDNDDLLVNRYWTSANAKFTDTRLGGNIGINARPQWCWYSDIREKGRLAGRNEVTLTGSTGNYGMGNLYSTIIDDPSQTIYMRMGVPQFNSLLNFFLNSFDAEASIMARTGRAATWYKIGRAAGIVGTVMLFPGIAAVAATVKTLDFFWRRPRYKFYTLKPTMHLYWSAVDNILGGLVTAAGFYPKVFDKETNGKVGQPQKIDSLTVKYMEECMPDLFPVSGRFDAYAIANRAQRLANQAFNDEFTQMDRIDRAEDYAGLVRKNQLGGNGTIVPIPSEKGKVGLEGMLNRYASFQYWLTNDATAKNQRAEFDASIDPNGTDGKGEPNMGFLRQLTEHLDADFRDGNQFAIFKVDHTGSQQESFSSQAVESELSSKINNFSSQVRELRFSLADGNLVDGVIGMAQDAAAAAVQVVQGAASGLTYGLTDVITGLSGGAGFIDIPKHWQSSSADLPRGTYTMTLIAPYGNPISRIQNIYLPMAMLLATALPIAVGKTAYQSPFLVQLFDRGRVHIRTGMVESLSFTRGTSNLPFDMKGNALAIEVSMTIVDLSSIMHMPMSAGMFGWLDMTSDEDNVMMDYLATLAAQDLYSQIYNMEKAKLAFQRAVYRAGAMMSPAAWGSGIHESMTSGALKYIGVGALIEGLARGTDLGSRSPN